MLFGLCYFFFLIGVKIRAMAQTFFISNHDLWILTAILTVGWLLLFRVVAFKFSLVDKPQGRKTHIFLTPAVGGIAIFFSCILAIYIHQEEWLIDCAPLFVASFLMLTIGAVDDRFDLPARIKLSAQFAISLMYLVVSGSSVTELSLPLGFSGPIELGVFSVPFTLVAIVGLINAINMIDGCDGLAASLTIISLFGLAVIGLPVLGPAKIVPLGTVLIGLLVFLFFNFSNRKNLKTFLGDGGSLFIGFFVAANLIAFAEADSTYDTSIVLWFVAVPVFDFVSVVIRRLVLRRKIMAADRSHIHHYILSKGFSHFQTTMLISMAAVTLLAFGVFVSTHHPNLGLFSFLVLLNIYLFLLIQFSKVNH